MSILKIHTYPDEVLKKPAESIKDVDGDLQVLIDSMAQTMYAAPGVGLAAPQVGVSQRLIVIDASRMEEESPLIVIVNPEIVSVCGTTDSEEGCLSVPGYQNTIRRDETVLVRGFDRHGKPIEMEATGLLSRVLQHEIDHLNGVLFIDRLSPFKKKLFTKRYARALDTE
ncbi:MAG: peptide deformylase [bacterium]